MWIIQNKFLPFKKFSAINLFGMLFTRNRGAINEFVINHERIHTAQMVELGFALFYVLYFAEWIVRLFMKGNAYYNISFEREAYQHHYDLNYLKHRRHYAQWRRLKD